jgi:hypothetical protein
MTTYGFLLLLSCSILFNDQASLISRADCELKARVELERSIVNSLEQKATIQVDTPRGTFKYVFYDVETGRLLQKDFSRNSVDGLKPGKYCCVVVEDGGCTTKVQFEIQ